MRYAGAGEAGGVRAPGYLDTGFGDTPERRGSGTPPRLQPPPGSVPSKACWIASSWGTSMLKASPVML